MPKPPSEPTPPAERATGSELAAIQGRNPHTGQPQGALHPHGQGSNGGVHRGPDLLPRGVSRAIFLKALTDAGLTVDDLEAMKKSKSGKRKHRATPIPAAMVRDLTRLLKNIARDGAKGNPRAYRPGLQLLKDLHDMEQDESKNGRGSSPLGPLLSQFGRPAPTPPPAPVEPVEEGIIDKDGNVYVDGDA